MPDVCIVTLVKNLRVFRWSFRVPPRLTFFALLEQPFLKIPSAHYFMLFAMLRLSHAYSFYSTSGERRTKRCLRLPDVVFLLRYFVTVLREVSFVVRSIAAIVNKDVNSSCVVTHRELFYINISRDRTTVIVSTIRLQPSVTVRGP